jgi:hypothetical protein
MHALIGHKPNQKPAATIELGVAYNATQMRSEALTTMLTIQM